MILIVFKNGMARKFKKNSVRGQRIPVKFCYKTGEKKTAKTT